MHVERLSSGFPFSFSSLTIIPHDFLTVDIFSTSFFPRLLVFPERMRVATTPLLITVWGYVRSEQADFMKILSRPQ